MITMFNMSLSDDLDIIVSRHVNDGESVAGLINKSGRLICPRDIRHRPQPVFLQWHHENRFKQ